MVDIQKKRATNLRGVKKYSQKKPQLRANIDKDKVIAIKDIASDLHVSISEFVEMAIDEYIENHYL